jgi:hypothetical protein
MPSPPAWTVRRVMGPVLAMVMALLWARPGPSPGVAAAGVEGGGETDSYREYQIKAAYCYKFLFFSEWPHEDDTATPGTITVGVVGDQSAERAFSELEGQEVRGEVVRVIELDSTAPGDDLRRCRLLFIARGSAPSTRDLLRRLGSSPVLTVGEAEDFAANGGMIELVLRDGKVRFIVNRAAAERVGISFRARFLRLAEQVMEGGP